MDKLRTVSIFKEPWRDHAAFIGLWALLLFTTGYLYQGGDRSPWWGWGLGLAPVVAGFIAFLALRKQKPVGWAALLAGEALGIVLGSTLLAGPTNPLMLLALWPISWAAMELPLEAGLGMVMGTTAAYLVVGLWQAVRYGLAGMAPLGVLLYVGVSFGVFFLLRTPERTSEDAALTTEEVNPDRPEMLAPTAPTTPGAPAAPAVPGRDDALHQDLRVARDIQVSLLLASSPRLPGWETSTSFLPARELGGDLYDFVELDPLHRGIMIGDVTGKGIPAALHMAVARTLFRIEARQYANPAEALTRLNRSMIEQIPQGCVTLLFAHLNINDGTLRLANAGHNYPLLLDESAHELTLDGLPLGIDGEYAYAEISARLNPGDVLIFYTDGVVEAINAEGELFGFDRLYRLLAEATARRPLNLTRQIVRAVRSFAGSTPQNDDITLVVLRRRHEDRILEILEVARDVLGTEAGKIVGDELESMDLPPDAPEEAWRAAALSLASFARERWGHGPSRELLQQLFLALEGF